MKQLSYWETGRYTFNEEAFSSISHGFGMVFAFVGTIILIGYAFLSGGFTHILSAAVYGSSLIVMYTASTLYHALPFQRVKEIFRVFDHCSIFLLIAGTYTPVCLIALGGTYGSLICLSMWILAIIGIALNCWNLNRMMKISVVLYILMGWALILTIHPLLEHLELGGLLLLLAGGLIYTVGVIFYLMKKHCYTHSIWHLFVLSGSVLHFLAILIYVLPLR